MPVISVNLNQVNDATTEAHIRTHDVLIDRPESKGGNDQGAMGGELLLAALGGCFNSNLLLVETERKMMQAADETIVLVDSSKLGRQSLALVCNLAEIDVMVVDHEISEDWRSRIAAAGVELKIAGPTDNE